MRKLGFRDESQGLMNRYINADGAWDNHLERTRNFIARVVKDRKFDNLAVLGSGWLLDVPIDLLSGIAGHVWLYDAVHPAQVIHSLKQYPNVTAISADISGGALENAFQSVNDYKIHGIKWSPDQICTGRFSPEAEPDFTISINLLSQIGVMITDYLSRYMPIDQPEAARINTLLQQAHLQLLLPGRSCMVTDVREINTDLDNGSTATTELIGLPFPAAVSSDSWEWLFDTEGSYRVGKRTVMQVQALEF